MADNKCCPYSFYVPVKDQSLCDFLEAQSNLSMSIRLLVKAFIANCGDEIPDITTMDLKDLLNNAKIDVEKINKDIKKNPTKIKQTSESKVVQQKPEETAASKQDDTVISQAEQTSDKADESTDVEISISEEEEDVAEISVVEDEPEYEEEIVVETEPAKSDTRSSYNSKQNGETTASMEDIMSMLGGD